MDPGLRRVKSTLEFRFENRRSSEASWENSKEKISLPGCLKWDFVLGFDRVLDECKSRKWFHLSFCYSSLALNKIVESSWKSFLLKNYSLLLSVTFLLVSELNLKLLGSFWPCFEAVLFPEPTVSLKVASFVFAFPQTLEDMGGIISLVSRDFCLVLFFLWIWKHRGKERKFFLKKRKNKESL